MASIIVGMKNAPKPNTIMMMKAAMAMVRMRRFPGKTLFGALITATSYPVAFAVCAILPLIAGG